VATKKINRIFHRVLSMFVTFILVTVLISEVMVNAVNAAGDNTTGFGTSSTEDREPIPAASANKSINYDSSQDDSFEALGFPTEQLARISPSGKEIDKTKNPLGPDLLVLNRFNQLAFATGGSGQSSLFVHEEPILDYGLNLANMPLSNVSNYPPNYWGLYRKAITPADVNGDGKQEIISVGQIRVGTKNGTKWEIPLYVTDFNQRAVGKRGEELNSPLISGEYKVAQDLPYTQVDHEEIYLKTVAGDFDQDGKDEIAVSFENRLFLCEADLNGFKVLSAKNFERTIGDLEAGDSDRDGFKELLVTVDGEGGGLIRGISEASLYIFDGTDLSKSVEVKLKSSDGRLVYTHASIDIGDVFGDGSKRIIIGGAHGPRIMDLAYVRYHQDTETYDTSLEKSYRLLYPIGSVSGNVELKCATLKTPIPGEPEHVVLGGFIFLYNQVTDAFEQKEVTSLEVGNFKANSNSRSKGSITNINVNDNNAYIYETLVGNFDGNTEGREQIIMLHLNEWHGGRYVYTTSCAMNSDGELLAKLVPRQKLEKDDEYPYHAICAPDIHNRGVTLEFQPDKSRFVFSNPTVISILAATPYYKELEDKQANLYNVGTTFGTETETGTSESNGFNIEAGISFGFEQGVGMFGIKFMEVEFETQITSAFSAAWTSARSVSKSVSYTNLYMEDSVVAMVLPNDIYYYKVYTYENGNKVESELVMNVPYSPITTIMPLEDYNRVAAEFEGAPVIGPEVLKHTVGNPRTYPISSQGLSNIKGNDVLVAGSNDEDSFVSSGTGNGLISQDISISTASEKAFDYSFNISVSYSINAAGATSGSSFGSGYSRSVSVSNSKTTTHSGSVASVPSGYERFAFKWALAVYNYDLKAGDNTQRCTVLNYIVRPMGSYPPEVPDNFKVNSRTLKSTTLEWNPAEGAAGYRIFRSKTQNGDFKDISGIIQGRDITNYTDNNLEPNQNYYYYIVASANKDSVETAPLEIENLSVTGIVIRKQPKLVYDEDDALNLTDLTVRLKISGNSNEDVLFSEFAKYNITTSIANGVALKAGDNGIPVTVKYVPGNVSANTNNLIVHAKTPYDLVLDVSFTVGNVSNADRLLPGRKLQADITLRNKTSQQQKVVVILALYSDAGDMVDNVFLARTIEANATDSMTQTIQLPRPVKGHTAKVFVLDGADLSSTTLIPKSDSAQISAP